MKFFKFLFILSIFTPSISFAAECSYRLVSSPGSYSTMEELCKVKEGPDSKPIKSGTSYKCSLYGNEISVPTGCPATSCIAGATNVYSGSITVQKWKDDSEYLDLTDQAVNSFTGTSVCASSCIHSFDFLGDAEGDALSGPVTFKGKYVSTTTSCTSPTSGPVKTLTGKTGGQTGGDTGGETGGQTGGGTTPEDSLSIISAIRTQGQDIKDAIYTTGSAASSRYYDFKNSFFDRLSGISEYITAIFNRQADTNQILNSIDQKIGDTAASQPETDSSIKDWLTEDFEEPQKEILPEKELSKQNFSTDIFTASPECPAPKTLSMQLLGRKTFTYSFSFDMWCDKLAIFGQLILLASYAYGALIVVRSS